MTLLRQLGLACVPLCVALLLTGCGASPEETSAAAPKPKSDRIEQEMRAWLVAGSEPGFDAALESIVCTKSEAFEQVGAIDDFHNWIVATADRSDEVRCVLSRGERVFDGSIPGSCEEAEAGELYRLRLALIDAGLRAFDRGRENKGMALFDRVERGKLLLSKVLGEIRADTCSPL